MKNKNLSCPSSIANEHAKIIGIKLNEEVNILPQLLPVTNEFLKLANKDNTMLKDFRFTNKCIESSCNKWNGNKCGLVDKLIEKIETQASKIPLCSIRQSCRWYSQKGFDACIICEKITYEMENEVFAIAAVEAQAF